MNGTFTIGKDKYEWIRDEDDSNQFRVAKIVNNWPETVYTVVCGETGAISCTCLRFERGHRRCKHMIAIETAIGKVMA